MADEIILQGRAFNFLPYNATTNPYGLGGDGHTAIAPGETLSNFLLFAQCIAEEAAEDGDDAAIAAIAAAGFGFAYTYSTTTTASDPGTGTLRFNNATLSSATALYISETTSNSQNIAATLATWDDGTSTIRGTLKMYKVSAPTTFAEFTITGTLTDGGTWDTFTVAYVSGSGSFSNADTVALNFYPKGDKGDTGATGATYDISASTAETTFSNIVDIPCSIGSGSSNNRRMARATFLAGIAADSTFGTNLASNSSFLTALFGRQAIWCPAGFVKPSASGGCAAVATVATAANQIDITSLDFDAITQEYCQFQWPIPAQWNEGTITFIPVWSHAATVTNFGVVWDLQAIAVSDDESMAQNFGTAQTSVDTGGTTNDIYFGPESSAITVAGTPVAGDIICFRGSRVTGNGSDTMAIDARLHGFILLITTVKGNDS